MQASLFYLRGAGKPWGRRPRLPKRSAALACGPYPKMAGEAPAPQLNRPLQRPTLGSAAALLPLISRGSKLPHSGKDQPAATREGAPEAQRAATVGRPYETCTMAAVGAVADGEPPKALIHYLLNPKSEVYLFLLP